MSVNWNENENAAYGGYCEPTPAEATSGWILYREMQAGWYAAGYTAFVCGEPLATMWSQDHVDGWLAAEVEASGQLERDGLGAYTDGEIALMWADAREVDEAQSEYGLEDMK